MFEFGNGLKATLQVLSAASLNLGRSQNGEWVTSLYNN